MIHHADVVTTVIACLLLVPVSGCLVASETESEPDLGEVASPVIGGKAATQEQINSTVAILAPDDPTYICSGILIAPSVVATAAHCIFKDKNKYCLTEFSNYELTVVAGALDVTTANEDQRYEVATLPHRNDFVCPLASTLGKANDLAVLTLKRPVTSLSPVSVLPIDKFKSILSKGTLVAIEGYGSHDGAMMQFGQLYTAETPFQESNDTEFIAGGISAPDTCVGDSGGPVYLTIEGTKYVVGMTSRQNREGDATCSTGLMSIYTIIGNDVYNTWLINNSSGSYTGSSFNSGGVDGGVDGGSGIPGCNCTVGDASAPERPGLWLSVGLVLLAVQRRRS